MMSPTQSSLLAALDADNGIRVPHEVVLAIMDGTRPILAYRNYHGLSLQELSQRTGLAVGCLSDIERGIEPGSASALTRIASALGTRIDILVSE